MNNIQFSKMTLEDYEEIENILISEFDDFWMPEILKSELISENKIYIVAKENNEIVGFAGLILSIQEAEIMNIVTKKTKRNQGIGKLLLEKLIEIAQEKKCEKIFLEVNENNKIAIEMYMKFGFEKIGKRTNYYNSSESAILMSKKQIIYEK